MSLLWVVIQHGFDLSRTYVEGETLDKHMLISRLTSSASAGVTEKGELLKVYQK